jgi:hypothetical protein
MSATFLTPKLAEGESVDLSLYLPRERTNIRLYGLKNKDWIPADVADYKQTWRADATVVNIRGKYEQANRWLKEHLYMQDFCIIKFAQPDDSHDVLFKTPEEAMIFKLSFYQ